MEDLVGRVSSHVNDLSRAEAKVAEHLLRKPQDLAFLSVKRVADRVGVSTASVVRAAQAMGYAGYGELQQEVQMAVWSRHFEMRLSATIGDEGEDTSTSTFFDVMREDLEATRATMESVDPAVLGEIVGILERTRTVFVLGQRLSGAHAELFGMTLDTLVGNARVLGKEPGMLFDELAGMSEEDTLVAVCTPPYPADVVEFARMAREGGTKVVAITDTVVSPLVPCSDYQLFAAPNAEVALDVYGAASSILRGLANAVAARYREQVKTRLIELDKILGEAGIYCSPPNPTQQSSTSQKQQNRNGQS